MNYIDTLASRIKSAVPPSDIPAADTWDLFRIYAVLLLAKGEDVSAEDVHNGWVAWMARRDPQHESLVPYGMLSDSVAADDAPYVVAIRSIAHDQAS